MGWIENNYVWMVVRCRDPKSAASAETSLQPKTAGIAASPLTQRGFRPRPKNAIELGYSPLEGMRRVEAARHVNVIHSSGVR
jgi:hypothetical protein